MNAPRRRSVARQGRVLVVAILLLVVAAVVVLIAFRQPLLYGRMDPPEVALDDLEPALASYLRRRRADVIASPYDGDAWGALACAFDVHDYAREAADCYARAERLDPDEFRWPYFQGRGAVMTDQDAAIDAFRRAARIRDDHAPLHVYLGRSLILQGRQDEAEQAFARAAEIDPGNIRAHIGLAGVALEREDPRAALRHLERVLALGPKAEEAYWQLAQAHQMLGDDETAARYRARAGAQSVYLEPMPDALRHEQTAEHGVTARWRRTRAERAIRGGRLDLALAEWEALRRDDPTSTEAIIEAGQLKAQLGDLDGAIDLLRQGLATDPELHEARNNLGVILVRRGRLQEGIAELRASADALPGNADAHFNLAGGWRSAGQADNALAAFDRAIEIDPDHVRAHFERGVLLGSAGRLEESAEAFRRVIDRPGAPRAAYANLVHALERLGRREEAVEVLRLARAAIPNDLTIIRDLAWRLATSPVSSVRNGTEAIDLVEAVFRATGRREVAFLDTLAAAAAEVGDFARAQRCAVEAIGQIDATGRPHPLRRLIESRLELYRAGRPFRDEAGEG